MAILYTITTPSSGRKYIGRTIKEDYEKNHLKLLEKKKHPNKLLQTAYNNNRELEFKEILRHKNNEYVAKTAIKEIIDNNYHYASKGYNMFCDGAMPGRTTILDLFDEDILIDYALGMSKKDVLNNYSISLNVLRYRMKRNFLGKEQQILSTYEEINSAAQYELAIDGGSKSSAQILSRISEKYKISPRLAPTARKIAKNFMIFGIEKEKVKGQNLYTLKI